MPISHLLENFRDDDTRQSELASDVFSISERNPSYEDGYAAGWEAANEKNALDRRIVGQALSRNLQDLSFTFAEAKQEAAGEFEELMELVLLRILPLVAQETLGFQLVDILGAAAKALVEQPLQLVVNPQDADLVRSILLETPEVSAEVFVDEKLSEGAVSWRIGQSEFQMNPNELLKKIETAVRGFVHETQGKQSHA